MYIFFLQNSTTLPDDFMEKEEESVHGGTQEPRQAKMYLRTLHNMKLYNGNAQPQSCQVPGSFVEDVLINTDAQTDAQTSLNLHCSQDTFLL